MLINKVLTNAAVSIRVVGNFSSVSWDFFNTNHYHNLSTY